MCRTSTSGIQVPLVFSLANRGVGERYASLMSPEVSHIFDLPLPHTCGRAVMAAATLCMMLISHDMLVLLSLGTPLFRLYLVNSRSRSSNMQCRGSSSQEGNRARFSSSFSTDASVASSLGIAARLLRTRTSGRCARWNAAAEGVLLVQVAVCTCRDGGDGRLKLWSR